ncbi:hypothetical protein HMPREF9176_0350 [Streptococcus downei F0415]|nr:hypothetical protein HMPREF9176_0350 [Streptococcus downei F0415]
MLEAYTQVKSNKGSVGVSLDEIEVYLRQHWRGPKQLIN